MASAAREFEDLGEAEDWSVAQQKLALAYRGAGDLGQAQRFSPGPCAEASIEQARWPRLDIRHFGSIYVS
jgi:hypothetical protein